MERGLWAYGRADLQRTLKLGAVVLSLGQAGASRYDIRYLIERLKCLRSTHNGVKIFGAISTSFTLNNETRFLHKVDFKFPLIKNLNQFILHRSHSTDINVSRGA